MKTPVITLLTDFGTRDHYVAAMKSVILDICPNARIVDVSHEIEPWSIAEGSYTLDQASRTFPPGTIHVAVVDPGVGSSRRAIAAQADGQFFIGPDNGLLSLVLERSERKTIREIANRALFRQPVSDTFHGRDIFAPTGARLAKGLAFSRIGPLLKNPVMADFVRPQETGPGVWTGAVLQVDRFGNVITNFDADDFAFVVNRTFEIAVGRRRVTRFRPNYDAGGSEVFVLKGSSGFLELSANRADAARMLGVKVSPPALLTLRVLAA